MDFTNIFFGPAQSFTTRLAYKNWTEDENINDVDRMEMYTPSREEENINVIDQMEKKE